MAGTVFGQLERLKVLYAAVLASLTGTALLGLWEWWHKPVNTLDVYPSGVRPNINPDATVFLIVLAAALLVWTRSGRMRALAVLLLSLGLAAAYLSYFLNVWLGVIAALAVVLGARWGWRGALAWFAGVGVFGLAVLPILATILSQRLLGSDADRILLWQSALTVWSKSPLIGVGPGDLASYMETYSKFSITLVLQGYQEAHNIFLELLAEIGIVGLLVFLGFVIVVLIRLTHRLPGAEHFDRQFRSAAAALVVAGAVMASVGSGLVPTIATEGWTAVAPVVLTWFFAGCGVALSLGTPDTAPA
jgi:O-antigen ligase